MKVPRSLNTYCPRCRAKTEHRVSIYRRGRESALRKGARHHEWDLHGYGGQKFPEQRRHAKTTKKQVILLRCVKCGYTLQRLGVRLTRIEVKRM